MSIVLTIFLAWWGMTSVLLAASSPVADAAQRLDRSQLRSLLQSGASVQQGQADGMTALHWAAYHHDLEIAKTLRKAGASVSATNDYGISPLMVACEVGDAEMVEWLLAQGADARQCRQGGETVLMTASRTGRGGCVKALLKHGAEVNVTERAGQTALMWAAAEGHGEVVEILLRAGANDALSTPQSGFDALFFAARQGHQDVVRLLLRAGMDVNRVMDPKRRPDKGPEKGCSPLVLSIENGHYELALMLLDAGADPNDQRSGFAPLHIMTWVRKPPKGEDKGAPPPPELGPISSLQFIRELVKRGADVNLRLSRGSGGWGKFSTQGATPFLMAAATADLPYMKLLLELGADPGIANSENTTPLMAACGIHVGSDQATEVAGEESEVLEAAEIVLQRGADVNAVDMQGETAMHAAALKNLPKVVDYLASHGAKVEVWNQKNKFGSTPLMIAEGYRPGNFKPSFETVEAIQRVMLSAGVTLPAHAAPRVLRNSDWEPLKKP